MDKIKNNRGFTLMELILVLTLLGVLFSIVILQIDHTSFFLRTQSKLLCSEIRKIRLLRMTEGEGYKILLEKDKYKILNGSKELKTIQLSPYYKLLYRENRIMFSYEGAPIYGGDTISIKNIINNEYMEITIVPSSGRVLLKDEIFSSQ